jgi:hypothetical protein
METIERKKITVALEKDVVGRWVLYAPDRTPAPCVGLIGGSTEHGRSSADCREINPQDRFSLEPRTQSLISFRTIGDEPGAHAGSRRTQLLFMVADETTISLATDAEVTQWIDDEQRLTAVSPLPRGLRGISPTPYQAALMAIAIFVSLQGPTSQISFFVSVAAAALTAAIFIPLGLRKRNRAHASRSAAFDRQSAIYAAKQLAQAQANR